MQSITLSAQSKVYKVVFVILGGLTAVAVGMIFVHPSFLKFAAVFLCVLLLSLLWLRAFKVIISDNGISKNTLFERPNMITWSAIRDAQIRVVTAEGMNFVTRLGRHIDLSSSRTAV